ncbi:NAD-dependent isocitrate dehydrogenase [Formicincola oecophyllae]|uniref:NAD-dependent isocitrate dehydrogenase n=1 Tax=Formicincola oecophyllae TaxID=2558361 RepID=A0A4Y6U892_9PROT|nr:isocitrate/isopropylmalate family dehydrogenase [Formicincola oecophyllae]QDH13394.1 NAD-dependent isocitrate dehydrogenase [Formicincola oecophyllae]
MTPTAAPHNSNVTGKIPATLIPGDGIGPEITAATTHVLDKLGAPFAWDVQQAGMAGLKAEGAPVPDSTMASIKRTGLALKGPLTTPSGGGFRSVNVTLRQAFDLYANVRPARTLVPGRYEEVDIVLIRENVEGFYAAREYFLPQGGGDGAHGAAEAEGMAVTAGYVTRAECRRIVRHAFEYALAHGRKKVTLVHKANILKLMGKVFLEEGHKVAADYAGRVACDERIVDACAMQLCLDPSQFDVIVTTNLFGDILSDQISGLIGGLGMAPGANIGEKQAIFEAVHGSAPDLAGRGVANPVALMLAAGLMLDHVGEHARANSLRQALDSTLKAGVKTPDLGGTATTEAFAKAVAERL